MDRRRICTSVPYLKMREMHAVRNVLDQIESNLKRPKTYMDSPYYMHAIPRFRPMTSLRPPPKPFNSLQYIRTRSSNTSTWAKKSCLKSTPSPIKTLPPFEQLRKRPKSSREKPKITWQTRATSSCSSVATTKDSYSRLSNSSLRTSKSQTLPMEDEKQVGGPPRNEKTQSDFAETRVQKSASIRLVSVSTETVIEEPGPTTTCELDVNANCSPTKEMENKKQVQLPKVASADVSIQATNSGTPLNLSDISSSGQNINLRIHLIMKDKSVLETKVLTCPANKCSVQAITTQASPEVVATRTTETQCCIKAELRDAWTNDERIHRNSVGTCPEYSESEWNNSRSSHTQTSETCNTIVEKGNIDHFDQAVQTSSQTLLDELETKSNVGDSLDSVESEQSFQDYYDTASTTSTLKCIEEFGGEADEGTLESILQEDGTDTDSLGDLAETVVSSVFHDLVVTTGIGMLSY